VTYDDDSARQPDALESAAESGEPVPAMPVAAAQAIRFCRACGAPWDQTWPECPRCAGARTAASARMAQAEVAYQSDRRHIRSAMALYFALLGVSALLLFILLVAGREGTAGEELFATAAMSAITTAWCVAFRGDVLPRLLQPVRIVWFPIAVMSAGVTFTVASAAVYAINHAFEAPDLRYLDSFVNDGWSFGWAVVGICVMPGVFEELAFRGVIFGTLQRVLGSTEALLVSALMFAILHLLVPSMPHLFLMGVALAWLRIKTGSLLPGMLTHFTHNLLVLLAERYDWGLHLW
jgi:membrane protease YdiL (CAAX protease family)